MATQASVRTQFTIPENPRLRIPGPAGHGITLHRADLDKTSQATRAMDMHCVVTWSVVDTPYTGWLFDDVWDQVLTPVADARVTHVVFTAPDGAAASIALEDLRGQGAMLAHSRDGQPLGRDHGAPYRLVVPQLYGYKHIKHVCSIELSDHHVKGPHEPWIMHPRARVDHEERSGLGIGRLVRRINRSYAGRALKSAGVPEPRFR